jgi:hypothetical protein
MWRRHWFWRSARPAWIASGGTPKADGTYQPMREHHALRPSLTVTTAEGNQFDIVEIGSPQSTGRPQRLGDLAQWSRSHAAVFVAYFDRGGVRLTDPPSQQAWREAVSDT